MKKRIFSAILSVFIIMSLLANYSFTASASTYSGECGNDLIWSFDITLGVLTISGTGDMRNYKNTVVNYEPWYDCLSYIKTIRMSNGVTSIGDNAFIGCSELASIEIPSSVTSIGDHAFESCSGLTSIEIPSSVTSIGDGAFESCSGLTSIEIPSSVTSIGNGAFYNCSELTTVNIPDGVTSIGDGVFKYCSGLAAINIPDGVTSIGDNAIYLLYHIFFKEDYPLK